MNHLLEFHAITTASKISVSVLVPVNNRFGCTQSKFDFFQNL